MQFEKKNEMSIYPQHISSLSKSNGQEIQNTGLNSPIYYNKEIIKKLN